MFCLVGCHGEVPKEFEFDLNGWVQKGGLDFFRQIAPIIQVRPAQWWPTSLVLGAKFKQFCIDGSLMRGLGADVAHWIQRQPLVACQARQLKMPIRLSFGMVSGLCSRPTPRQKRLRSRLQAHMRIRRETWWFFGGCFEETLEWHRHIITRLPRLPRFWIGWLLLPAAKAKKFAVCGCGCRWKSLRGERGWAEVGRGEKNWDLLGRVEKD